LSSDAAHPNPLVARRLSDIYKLHRKEMDLRLADSPYLDLLHALGDPHNSLPPVVHIAGTNGKGSTLAMLRAMLEAAGYRAHVYTSPHLILFNERVRLAGTLIDDKMLIDLIDRVNVANAGRPITFFEFTTALAFVAFNLVPADIVLLETGMGGRLDCTNAVDHPFVTAITKISYDHMDFLGHTLPDIAAEKAGIMKRGAPCVIGSQMAPEQVMPVFRKRAGELGIDLIEAPALPRDYPAPNLVGSHQLENAALALAIADQLRGFDIPAQTRRHGLRHTEWPGRMQRITAGPVAAQLPEGWELWFDAAHNDSGAQALAVQLQHWRDETPEKPVHLVVGLAGDKDVKAFFGPLEGLYDTLALVDLPHARVPRTAAALALAIREAGFHKPAALYENVPDAILSHQGGKPIRVIVAGSMYLYEAVV